MSDEKEPSNRIDCSGLCCSLPLVEARMQLDKMQVGETLEVVATCPSSEKDMQILTALEQFELVRTWKDGDKVYFAIKKVK